MKIGDLVRFHEERFFEGAVQLRWVQEREAQAQQAARAFVFHGPRYHGASDAEKEGIEGGYRLKDTASLARDLLQSILDGLNGRECNPYALAVAGYGGGKSHFAVTCAPLLADPHGATAQEIVAHIAQADPAIGQAVQDALAQLTRPVLVLTLDGMAGFHLGNALVQAVFAQLQHYGVDAGAIRDLSPRFQTAEQFVERNFAFRAERFAQRLPGLTAAEIGTHLQNRDEATYTEVDALYDDANGSPIPVVGQESAQELINTLCEVYCGPQGAFSSVVILFDEFGRYLEYAAEKPHLAGDAALQQIFQGVQDNSQKVRLIGFIQYELKAYLKRFSSADLRQLQRYITRFDAAEKWYLSTNLETIFAHIIDKDEPRLAEIWRTANAERQGQLSWKRMQDSLPGFQRFPVWNDPERFARVIVQGCWPLHPLATWFLTRQRDIVQSRSALTFIKDVIERISDEDALTRGRLRQVSAAELALRSLLPEMIAAERETGATVAETLQGLLEKFQGHLNDPQRLALAGVAILEKMRVGKQTQPAMDTLLGEAAALDSATLHTALQALSQELGAVEWNADLGHYELIADATTRGQFQQWLRRKQTGFTAEAVRDLFLRRGAKDGELGHLDTDFHQSREIATREWGFAAQLAQVDTIENAIQRAFQAWQQAILPKDLRGQLIYLYLHADDDLAQIETRIRAGLDAQLQRTGYAAAPVWIVGLADRQGTLAEHLGRLYVFEEQLTSEDRERFRRFIPEETARSRQALQEAVAALIKERLYWVAGFPTAPTGRLKAVGEAIFAQVYPEALPFPFDGFATTAGGGPADCAQLTRSLIARQVDGAWVQTQKRQLQNRVNTLLAQGWRALLPSGQLTAPQEPKVQAVYQWLQHAHQEEPQRTLWTSYQALIAPPYGMNAASAQVLLGLFLGIANPPRRIEQDGEMIAASDWADAAFPNARSHYLNQGVLESSTLRFLAEDSVQRWRDLLSRWDAEKSYQGKVTLGEEARRLTRVDPLPETQEGLYRYLCDQTVEISSKLHEARAQLDDIERSMEKAERQEDVGWLLKLAFRLTEQRRELENVVVWPERYRHDAETLLAAVRQFVTPRAMDWILRQSCQNIRQVGDFGRRMEKAAKSLILLQLPAEARKLEQQAQQTILQVEKRQQFKLTLDESDDYPRQPDPSESTPVRELRDDIVRGDELIEAVRATASALSADEINARVKAIQQRQQRLNERLKQQRDTLSELYDWPLTHQAAVQEALIKVQRLHGIFVDTRDQGEISEMVLQLESLLAAVSAWETGEVSVERVQELLQGHIERQGPELHTLLTEKDIEPTWDLATIFQALADERLDAARQRSTDWLQPRVLKAIDTLNAAQCREFEQELQAAPSYLSSADRMQVEQLLETVRRQRSRLEEQARRARVGTWLRGFLAINDVSTLDKDQTQRLLQALRHPPDELRPEERAILQPITTQLTAHLDQMSLDEIINRIEQLPVARQRQLLALLMERWEIEMS